MGGDTVVLGESREITSSYGYDADQTSDFEEGVVTDADEENTRKLGEMIDYNCISFELAKKQLR